VTLRPYQLDLVELTRDAFRKYRRVIMQLSTGGGKTCIAAYIGSGAYAKGNQMLVLTHRQEIKGQLVRAFTGAGVPCADIGTDSPCHIDTIGIAANRLGTYAPPDFIFVDEFQHAVSTTFLKVIEAFPNAKVLGLTATPQRLDGKGLNQVADVIVSGPSMKWLIANGWLKQPIYYAPKELVDVSGLRKTGGDFNHADLEKLMAKPSVTGNAVIEYQRLANGRTALAFCVTVAHAEGVARAFSEAGITSESVDGKLSKDERAERLARLASGRTKVLTSCELISEGFDAPAVGAVISLRPTASLTMHMQQIGRGLRPSTDSDCIVLDHAGNCFRHGLAEEDREWSLEGKAKRKVPEKLEEIHRCQVCYAVFAGAACSQCGIQRAPSPRELKQKEGEMQRLLEVRHRIDHKAEERAAKTLEDLQAIALKRGYSPKWAWIRWKTSWRNRKAMPKGGGKRQKPVFA